MSDNPQDSNNEQIPPGFTPEVWAQLTPEQKQVHLQQGQQQATMQQNAAAQQDSMMKNVKRMTIISMITGVATSLLPGSIRRIFRRFF